MWNRKTRRSAALVGPSSSAALRPQPALGHPRPFPDKDEARSGTGSEPRQRRRPFPPPRRPQLCRPFPRPVPPAPRRRRIGPRRRRSHPPSRIAVPSLGGELSLRLHPGDLAGGLGGGGVARSPARVDRVPVLSGGHGYVGHGGWIMSGVVSCSGGEWERVGYAGSPEWDSAARLQSWGWGCSRGQYCRLLSASQAGIFVTGPHSVFLICIVIIMYIVQNVQ